VTPLPPKPHELLWIDSEQTVRQALAVMTDAFKDAGLASASADARFLLQGVLQLDAADVFRDPEKTVGDKAHVLTGALQRRLRHEPVSRILGTREFYGRQFLVTPAVLDPRPETECLIDLVLDIVRSEKELSGPLIIADIGTGSGAIIATLLAELPHAQGIATDISPEALDVARANSARLGVLDRLTLLTTRGLTGVNVAANVIVSNPPYIASAHIPALDIDVRDYDPHLALDGGADGLDIYREIARDISKISGSCWIFLEIGAGQADDVEAIFVGAGAIARRRSMDLGGHIRALAFSVASPVALKIHR
jgi:release factor glutamine methyltransferase